MHDGDPSVRRIIDFAKQLEGVARNASTHAAGVVISREPLAELMPLQKATNSDATMTQYEMHGIEALGLLKFDFLGLSNLTILRAAVDRIREQRGVEIDLERIPLDDPTTFALLASGETTGVFQLESAGMRRYIRELRPTSVYDLAAMVALYRPGPMENIPAYIRRKHGQEKVTYLHPLLEPFLERTHGIFVYQEDIMAAAIALGGFSGPEADTLGYAIRKKKSSVLRSMKDQFVQQAGERGVRPDTIDAVFKAFEPFERYGFNKAHATTYGLVAYQTAYLKANYTVEYMASVLTAFRDNAEKVAAAVAECRRLGIAVLPPDVHASHLEFTVEGPAIRFGLLAVKNVGQGAIESIIAARESEGPFRSFADFCNRIDLRLVNKRVLESLIKVGALNAFGHPAQLLVALDDVLAAAQADQRERASGQISFFDLAAEPASLEAPLPAATEVPVRERLRWEKELLGLYLSDHPLGRGRGADREVRHRLLGRAEGRVARRPAGRRRRGGDRRPDGDHEDALDDGRGDARGPPGLRRGGHLPEAPRADRADLAGGRDPPRRRPDRPPGRGGLAPGRPGARLRRRGGGRRGGLRGGGRGRRSGPAARAARARTATATGTANGNGAPDAPSAAARRRPSRRRRRRSAARRPPARPAPAGSAPAARRPAARPRRPRARRRVRWSRPTSRPLAPDREEPPLPDEARAAALGVAAAPTAPREAGPDGRLHVRFAAGIPADDLQAAMAEVRDVLRGRPGATRVTIHLPQGPGRPPLPMELRAGVAYDAELAAEVGRRLRPGLVELALAADPGSPTAPRLTPVRSTAGRVRAARALPGRRRGRRPSAGLDGARGADDRELLAVLVTGRRRSRPARCPARSRSG